MHSTNIPPLDGKPYPSARGIRSGVKAQSLPVGAKTPSAQGQFPSIGPGNRSDLQRSEGGTESPIVLPLDAYQGEAEWTPFKAYVSRSGSAQDSQHDLRRAGTEDQSVDSLASSDSSYDSLRDGSSSAILQRGSQSVETLLGSLSFSPFGSETAAPDSPSGLQHSSSSGVTLPAGVSVSDWSMRTPIRPSAQSGSGALQRALQANPAQASLANSFSLVLTEPASPEQDKGQDLSDLRPCIRVSGTNGADESMVVTDVWALLLDKLTKMPDMHQPHLFNAVLALTTALDKQFPEKERLNMLFVEFHSIVLQCSVGNRIEDKGLLLLLSQLRGAIQFMPRELLDETRTTMLRCQQGFKEAFGGEH